MNDIVEICEGEEGEEWIIEKYYKTTKRYQVRSIISGKVKKVLENEILLNISNMRKLHKLEEEEREMLKEHKKRREERNQKYFILYNILDDHKIQVKSDLERLEKMVDYLIYHKYFVKNFLSDEEFLTQNQMIREKVHNN